MRATEELAKRQRESPLGLEGDRVQAIFRSLPKLADARFEQVRLSANLAAGEMNFRQPNAKTFHFPDGTHLITIFTGLIDFYASACKVLFGAANFYTGGKEIEGQSMGDVIAELEALFRRWTPQGIADDRTSELAQTVLPPEKARSAAILLEGALRFILCHELGHVLFYDPGRSKTNTTALTKEQETISDVEGMKTAVVSAPSAGYGRMNLAGCVVSLRVLAVFATLGHEFSGDHPDPLSRVNDIFAALKEWCSSSADYWWISTIAYAFDDQLETAGQRALGGPDTLPFRADRAFSRMSAALEEVIKKHQEETIIVPMMAPEFEEASDAQLKEVAMYAAEMFAAGSPAAKKGGQLWAEKGEKFRSLYHQWPKRVSDAFDEAFAVQKQAGA